LFDAAADVIEDGLFIKTILRVEPVIGRPILPVPVLRSQKRADGVAAEARQMRQEMTAGARKTLAAGKEGSAAIDECF
jgi:hypothetical protein